MPLPLRTPTTHTCNYYTHMQLPLHTHATTAHTCNTYTHLQVPTTTHTCKCLHTHTHTHTHSVQLPLYTHTSATHTHIVRNMGWLRLVGSLKLQVSFAKEPYKRDYILQKRHDFKEPTNRSHPIVHLVTRWLLRNPTDWNVSLCCSVVQRGAAWHSVLHCVALCRSVLQCVAVCCSVLQCVAVCCSDFWDVVPFWWRLPQHKTTLALALTLFAPNAYIHA